MLKIRNDVDLKELEKFRFEIDFVTGVYKKELKSSYMDNCYIEVQNSTRIIIETRIKDEYIGNLKNTNTDELDTLYDLIQARISRKGVERNGRL